MSMNRRHELNALASPSPHQAAATECKSEHFLRKKIAIKERKKSEKIRIL